MSYKIFPSNRFKKEAKRLVKKFPSLKQELLELNSDLIENSHLGKSLGNNTFKIRIAIKSKGKGKTGGGRILTYVLTENSEIYLLTIYDKSEYDTVDDTILKEIIESLNKEK